jgi:hypothetical protein
MARSRVVDDDDDDDRPRKRRASSDDEDDEEDDRPRKKRPIPVDDDDDDDRPRKRRASPDDEDDEENDRPVRKKIKKKPAAKNNNKVILLAVGGVLLLGMLMFGAIGIWYFFIYDSPERAMRDIIRAQKNEDYGLIHDRMSNNTRRSFEQFAKMGNKYGDKQGRDLFIAFMKENNIGKNTAKDRFLDDLPEIQSSTRDGDKATVTVKFTKSGKIENLPFVKEDGTWRLAR